MRRLLVGAGVVVLLGASGVSMAFAGEVKGPPGTIANTNVTGIIGNARSECAFSGLNDYDPTDGQNINQVQTAADSWKIYGLPKGAPGKLGLCRGN